MTDYTDPLPAIERAFQLLGIPAGRPGFYDDAQFVRAERQDPRFLNMYARFVQLRPYDDNYLARAERVVRLSVQLLFAEIVRDGRLGGCIDASMVLSRILDREGIWNYVVKGALTVDFGSGRDDIRYFWPIDETTEATAAHVWVAAPIHRRGCHGQPPIA